MSASDSPPVQRTLREYVQHLPACELARSGLFKDGQPRQIARSGYDWKPAVCTCGLDALLTDPVKACGASKDTRDGDNWATAHCGLPAGHLGSHEGMAHEHRWFWNEHACGIMRDRHPTTNEPLTHRPLLTDPVAPSDRCCDLTVKHTHGVLHAEGTFTAHVAPPVVPSEE
jgi:hypothetical protein